MSAATFDWEAEGRRVGATLDAMHCVLVVGDDGNDTALVARGLAAAQATARHVAVGDLIGEAPPLQSLVTDDDPHGIVDAFEFGLALDRVARRVPGEGELFVLPTGSSPLDYFDLLPHPRWRKLAAGFLESGALLVLAVPASAPLVETLAAVADGVVLVGDVVPARLPVSRVLTSVRAPRPSIAPRMSMPAIEGPPVDTAAVSRVPLWRRPASIAGIAVAALLAAGGIWLAARPLADVDRRPNIQPGVAAPAAPPVAMDTTPAAPTFAGEVPPIVNPADSSRAARFSVSSVKLNTWAGAILTLRDSGGGMPAPTFFTRLIRTEPWYVLRFGAYQSREEAESLLVTLRGNDLIDSTVAGVAATPLAFLIDSARSPEAARPILARLAGDNLPAYGLRQDNGRVYVYLGAFETAIEAAVFLETLRKETGSGLTPALVYRTGRSY